MSPDSVHSIARCAALLTFSSRRLIALETTIGRALEAGNTRPRHCYKRLHSTYLQKQSLAQGLCMKTHRVPTEERLAGRSFILQLAKPSHIVALKPGRLSSSKISRHMAQPKPPASPTALLGVADERNHLGCGHPAGHLAFVRSVASGGLSGQRYAEQVLGEAHTPVELPLDLSNIRFKLTQTSPHKVT